MPKYSHSSCTIKVHLWTRQSSLQMASPLTSLYRVTCRFFFTIIVFFYCFVQCIGFQYSCWVNNHVSGAVQNLGYSCLVFLIRREALYLMWHDCWFCHPSSRQINIYFGRFLTLDLSVTLVKGATSLSIRQKVY